MSDAADDTLSKLAEGICLFPDNDTPRLVAADRLRDLGQHDRAEFIDVQVELASHPCGVLPPAQRHADSPTQGPCKGCDRVSALRRREEELWTPSWFLVPPVTFVNHPDGGATYARGSSPTISATVSRGFVSEVACTAALWLATADSLCWPPASVACRAAGPHHHGDVCSGGRVQSPNAQFTRECEACKGTGVLTLPRPTDQCPECEETTLVYIRGKDGRRIGGPSAWSGPTRGGWPVQDCPRCKNADGVPTGRVPRPFPPHAAPIAAVTLTTWPEWDAGVGSARRLRSNDLRFPWRDPDKCPVTFDPPRGRRDESGWTVARLLAAEWPFIRFELPAPPTIQNPTAASGW